MSIKKLIELLGEYNGDLIVSCIHYNEDDNSELTIDVYDAETGQAWIEYLDMEEN